MAVEISQELKDFKSATAGQVENLNGTLGKLKSAIDTINNTTSTASSGIDQYYKSANKDVVISSISSLGNVCGQIGTSLDSDLGAMISGVVALDGKITELEGLKDAIDEANTIISNETAKENDNNDKTIPNYTLLSSARSTVYKSTSEFNTLHSEALSQLAALKSKDGNLSFVKDFTKVDFGDLKGNLKFGKFTTKTFRASNGIEVKYYLYVPDYGQEVENLPVMLYMHGAGMEDTGEQMVTYGCLGEALQKKTVTPSGIIAIPYVRNGHLYESKDYRKALAELPVQVCKDYNGDKNRISCGGVSYGAVTAYRLVNENPGEFSAVVNACGAEEVTSAFKGVKVWNFSGLGNTGNHTSKGYVGRQTEAVKKAGGEAKFTQLDTYAHTNVGTLTFQNKFKDETGEEIYPFEWAFKQSKV